jgi:Zn-dependent peptidase ImmA (M78 family)
MSTTMRVTVQPSLLSWACDRCGRGMDYLQHRFTHLREWIAGESQPTFAQLQLFSNATYTPIGFFHLPQPPVDTVPIPDFRTVANARVGRPSPDLLDTIYICQQRQEWYRDFARSMGEAPRPFVGSLDLTTDEVTAAQRIRATLGLDMTERAQARTWEQALSRCIEQADAAGILVMCSGVVLNNNTRRLDPQEFRGFALSDTWAPLVFINGADTKAAQMFTLAHELAHLWLGRSAVSDAQVGAMPDQATERWGNRVAAEVLMPEAAIRAEFQRAAGVPGEMVRLARRYKVSTLVVLRRIRDIDGMNEADYWDLYRAEEQRLAAITKNSVGGDFYRTQAARVSKRFARALVSSTLEGQTLHRDAFRLLGFHKAETFAKLGHSLGVA